WDRASARWFRDGVGSGSRPTIVVDRPQWRDRAGLSPASRTVTAVTATLRVGRDGCQPASPDREARPVRRTARTPQTTGKDQHGGLPPPARPRSSPRSVSVICEPRTPEWTL